MKNKIILCLMLISMSFASYAQVFNITTGVGSIGSNDPNWTVRNPGSAVFTPATITTGLIVFGGNVYNSYAQDPCGQWISPSVNAANNIIDASPGTYTYRLCFEAGNCVSTSATLDISWIAADNIWADFRVNGSSIVMPGGITHTNPGSLNSTITIVPGTNCIEVDVTNSSTSPTALQLCGTVTAIGPTAPTNLDCCEATTGNVVSWGSVAGAIGYEVEVTYNDPDCCLEGNFPTSNLFTTTSTALVIPTTTTCYSWRVRSVFPNNCKSAFSEKMCGCKSPEPKCAVPERLGCEVQKSGRKLFWTSVAGASGYEVMITYNDPACCKTGLPSSIGLSTLSNSVFIGDATKCYSWKVRTICEDGTYSAWSALQCSCNSFKEGIEDESKSNTQNPDLEKIQVQVSPNPANEFVEFLVESKDLEQKQGDLTIININTNKTFTYKVNLNGSTKIELDHFPRGFYVYSIVTSEITKTGKLIIEK